MPDTYHLKDLSDWGGAKTSLAVLGHPVAHSLSPDMHNAALKALSEIDSKYSDWEYYKFDVPPEELAEALPRFREAGFLGLNLTVPHKVDACSMVGGIDPEAVPLGAVNTLKAEEDGFFAYNTDGFGLSKGLHESFPMLGSSPFWGRKVLILGAGGAARSAAFEAVRSECKKLYLGNRNVERRAELLQVLHSQRAEGFDISQPPREVFDADIVVNATSLGLKEGDPSPIALDGFSKELCVYDMIYNPPQTGLMKAAEARGIQSSSGLGMLVWQGARSLAIWTGQKRINGQVAEAFFAAEMRKAAEEALAG